MTHWLATDRLTKLPPPPFSPNTQVRSSLDMYRKILDVIEENDYDNFRKVRFCWAWPVVVGWGVCLCLPSCCSGVV